MEVVKPPAEEPTAVGPPPEDTTVIHVHLYDPQLKPLTEVRLSKQLLEYVGSGDKKAASAYATELEAARNTLLGCLGGASVSEPNVTSALNEYVVLLLGLVDAPAKPAAATTAGGADEAGADSAGAGAAAAPQQQGLHANSSLRRAASFAWQDVLLGGGSAVTYPDALFELSSVLTAAAVWYMRKAADLCRDSASGVASAASIQARGQGPVMMYWTPIVFSTQVSR